MSSLRLRAGSELIAVSTHSFAPINSAYGGRLIYDDCWKETTICFIIRGSLEPAQLRGLCEQARLALDALEVDAVTCDVRGLIPDAVAVDALARLQVIARRHGRELRLRGAGAELRELIALVGLGEALPADG